MRVAASMAARRSISSQLVSREPIVCCAAAISDWTDVSPNVNFGTSSLFVGDQNLR
jgi:hypothetical protein